MITALHHRRAVLLPAFAALRAFAPGGPVRRRSFKRVRSSAHAKTTPRSVAVNSELHTFSGFLAACASLIERDQVPGDGVSVWGRYLDGIS